MSGELIAALAVVAALLGALAQFRQTRLTEQQLRREVDQLHQLILRIEKEREDRESGEAKLRNETQTLHEASLRQAQASADSVFGAQVFGAQLLERTLVSLSMLVAHCQGAARNESPELQFRLEDLMNMVKAQEDAARALAARMQQVMDGQKSEPSQFPTAFKMATDAWEEFFRLTGRASERLRVGHTKDGDA